MVPEVDFREGHTKDIAVRGSELHDLIYYATSESMHESKSASVSQL